MTPAAPRWRPGDAPGPLLECLARGGVLAIPTESSYGLAVDPRSAAGVATVQRIKGRPEDKGLPVVAAEVAQIVALGVDPDEPALAWALAHWPAPLSVVLPLSSPLPSSPRDGSSSLAVRIPFHETLRQLLRELGIALTATSANPSGQSPWLDPAGLGRWLAGTDAMVIDAGVLPGGPPSTLVVWVAGQVQVLRAGAFPVERLGSPLAAVSRRSE